MPLTWCQLPGCGRAVQTDGHRHCCRKCRKSAGERHTTRCERHTAATTTPTTRRSSRSRSPAPPLVSTPSSCSSDAGVTAAGAPQESPQERQESPSDAADALQCSICWKPFRSHERCVALQPCGHAFHEECALRAGARCAKCRDLYVVAKRIFF